MFDWAAKEAVCRHMVTEGKTQDEMLEALKAQNFNPSKRAFQNQLKKWNFQRGHIPAAKRPDVVAAVEELWKQHVKPKEMLRILNEEQGCEIGARELAKLRTDNNWFLRARNGMEEGDPAGPAVIAEAEASVKGAADDSDTDEEQIAAFDAEFNNTVTIALLSPAPASSANHNHLVQATPHPTSTDLTPTDPAPPIPQEQEAIADQLTRVEERKARRRVNHPDTGKFPSEMKLEDCKKVLGIDERTYQAIRNSFHTICETSGIQRKKGCGIWSEAKTRLIDSVPALKAVLEQPMAITERERKALAVDLICQDRTKNVRRNAVRMDLATAKKILGLDPAGVVKARMALMARLKADGFSTKTEAGEEHWKELRDVWVAEQGLGGKGELGEKARNVICADVMKRMNDKRTVKRKEAKAAKRAAKLQDGQTAGEDGGDEDEETQMEGRDGADDEEPDASEAPKNGDTGEIQAATRARYGYYTPFTANTTTSAAAASPPLKPHPSAADYPEIDPALFYWP